MNKENMTNEKAFVESIVNFKSHVANAQKYIKENFNINSNFDEETNTLNIYSININESLNLAAAKEYLNNTIDEGLLNVKYGK